MKTMNKRVLATLLMGLLVLSACQPAIQAAEVSPTRNEQEQPAVPEIDVDQPDDFATATFSMG